LLDLFMPVMTGEEFCLARRAHQDWSSIPVVAISAAGERARALAAGACDFLSKPFDLPSLLNMVAHHL
jgi:CheY-like chemotaxis protein